MKICKKLNALLFLSSIEHNLLTPIIRQSILPNPITIQTMSDYSIPVIEQEATSAVEKRRSPRKKRTQEEIAAANAEKEQKKQEREEKRIQVQQKAEEAVTKRQQAALRKEQHSTALVPGTGIFAIAAMTILGLCAKNMPRTNLAFRQMFASRLIFPPKKNINKFATGGIAEESVSQLFCDVGLVCANLSEDANVIDLEIQVPIPATGAATCVASTGESSITGATGAVKTEGLIGTNIVPLKVSLKNSGKITSPPILENYRGQKRPEIRALPSTYIIYTETDIKRARIVYLDEEILRQGYPGLSDAEFHAEIYANNDSNLTFKSGFLAKFVPRLPAEYVLNAEFPEDLAGLSERSFAKLALAEVIRQLGAK